MLNLKEHKQFCAMLYRLRQRYPDRSYVQIIEDAMSFSTPYIWGPISDRLAFRALKQYSNKD